MGCAHSGSAAIPAMHLGIPRTSLQLHLRAYAFPTGKCCSNATWAATTFSWHQVPSEHGLHLNSPHKDLSLKPPCSAQSSLNILATLLSSLLSFAQSLLLGIFDSMCSAESSSSSSCSRRFREHLRAREHRRQCADSRCTTRGATAGRAHQARLTQSEALLPQRHASWSASSHRDPAGTGA